MRKAIILLVLMPCGPAQAQSITCAHMGDFTNCTQTPGINPNPWTPTPIQPFDLGRALRNHQALTPPPQPLPAPVAVQAAPAPMSREQALQSSVGHLIATGDCPGALRSALDGGDLDLATHVRAYCAGQK